MARLARVEVFAADEIAVVHVMARTVRRCFLLGEDAVTGKNYDHRKQWIDDQLVHLAGHFGIDLLCQAILSNHIHLVLRSRPDVVAEWGDSEVARRWLTPMSSAWHLYYMSGAWHLYYPLRPCKVPFQSQPDGDHGDDFLLRDAAIRTRFAWRRKSRSASGTYFGFALRRKSNSTKLELSIGVGKSGLPDSPPSKEIVQLLSWHIH